MPIKLQKFLPHLLPYLWAALSGLLLALAGPIYDLSWLIWIGLAPLFWATMVADHSKNTISTRAFRPGFIAGTIYFGFVYSFILSALPLNWAGIENPTVGAILATAIWLLITSLNALCYGIFTALATYFKNKLKLATTFVLIPFLWVGLEYLRAFWISIALAGDGSAIGAHWTIGHLGYALRNNIYLLQSADLWGIYGLSWLVVATNAAIFYFLTKYLINPRPTLGALKVGRGCLNGSHELRRREIKKVAAMTTLAAAIIITIFIYGANALRQANNPTKSSPPIVIALLQTDYRQDTDPPLEFLQQIHREISLLVSRAAQNNADIIVLPEGMNYLLMLPKDALPERPDGKPFLIIDNATLKAPELNKTFTIVAYYDSEDGLLTTSNKFLPVPFGEYIPAIVRTPARLLGFGALIEKFEAKRAVFSGQQIKTATTGSGNVGVMICSEPLSPRLIRNLSNNSAILFNISSQAVFNSAPSYLRQNQAILQVRAVENRRPIGQSSNGGRSFLIDASGKITAESSSTGNQILSAIVRPETKTAPYNRLGEWVVVLSGLVILAALLVINNRKT